MRRARPSPTLLAMRTVSRWILKLLGWRAEGALPGRRCVLIGAPHTSNWDFPFALLVMWALEIPGRWVGKHTLFRRPFGGVMRRLGGIPLHRERTENFVQQVVEWFEREDELVLVIAPEGTRSRTEFWRSGFYWIAHEAGVPIALGYLDYGRKAGGIGDSFVPSGEPEADMERIRAFYAGVAGKRPALAGEIRIRPRSGGGRASGSLGGAATGRRGTGGGAPG